MKPEEALQFWDIPSLNNIDPALIIKPSSGLLNKTYVINISAPHEASSELYILQCVHPAVSMDGSMQNYFHVTHYLRANNFNAQTLLKTKSGELWVEANNNWRWRLLKGVEGEFYEKTNDPALAEEAGKLLGQFHVLLSQYPDEIEKGRVSFQYNLEVEKLHQFEDRLMANPDESIRYAADLLLTQMPKLMLPKDLPIRIVHGDTKISNFLFDHNKKGIAMIDMDTIQKLSPVYDIGNAMRSWCGQDEDDPNNTFNKEIYNAFLKGYLSTSQGLLSERELALIPQATKLIILGSATRFLNDYIENSYFGWDETRYNSRKAHNLARTMGQISLYQSYLKTQSI